MLEPLITAQFCPYSQFRCDRIAQVLGSPTNSNGDNMTTELDAVSKQQLNDAFLTPQEAARIARVHPVTLLRWCREGRVPHRRLSARKVLFSHKDLTAWLASDYTGPVSRAA
jgi:excisionase family DNA binding protein